MRRDKYTAAEIEEARAAIAEIHPTICHVRAEHDWKTCMTGRRLYNGGTIDAMRHLKAHARDAAGARLILHNFACMSGCTGGSAVEHAKRHAKTVSALRKHLAVTNGA